MTPPDNPSRREQGRAPRVDSDPPPELPALTPLEHPDHDELERLVTGFAPTAPPAIHTANTAIGLVDQVVRVVATFAVVAVVLVILSIAVSPWIWIGAAAWIGFGVATITTMAGRVRTRAGRPPRQTAPPAIDPSRH